MYPAPFDYAAPETAEEAVGLLERYGDEAKVLAGGQSLIPMLHLGLMEPGYLIDINALEDGAPRKAGDVVAISAVTRQSAIERHPIVRDHCPLIAEAIRFIGNVRVRNRGTAGGNLAHADPSSELAVAGLASGASVTVAGPTGSRNIELDDLFVTYLETSLEATELITEIQIPIMQTGSGWAFLEMARRAGEFAIVNVAALMTLEEANPQVSRISVALGGVSDRPIDLTRPLSEVVVGSTPDDKSLAAAGHQAATLVEPRDDVHASGEYRKEIVRVYVRRALELALRRASEGNDSA